MTRPPKTKKAATQKAAAKSSAQQSTPSPKAPSPLGKEGYARRPSSPRRTSKQVSKKLPASHLKSPASPRTLDDWEALRPALDALVDQYKVPSYIDSDPIQIPYRYLDNPKACELVAFITALFSYGRRQFIIETVSGLFQITEDDPLGFLEQFNRQRDEKLFRHFIYRFNKGPDVAFLWERLRAIYATYGSLEALFQEVAAQTLKKQPEWSPLKAGIAGSTEALLNHQAPNSYGLKFLLAHPAHGGACKRFNMFLRWMVRQDDEAATQVDFGLWKQALRPADLLIPLDTHVMKMNKALQLSLRQDGSWRTAEDITRVFRHLCPADPVKYDYALFGFSLDQRSPSELLTVTH